MEKTVRIVNLKQQENDFHYWNSRSDQERLQAIEFLRQQYINYIGHAESGFQRVFVITNKKQC